MVKIMKELINYIDEFIDYITQSNYAKNTIISYEISCRYYYSYCNHYNIDFKNVSGSDMIQFRKSMNKYATSTINNRLSAVRHFYNYLIDIDLVESNPIRDSLFIRENRVKPKPLSENQEKLLYNFLNEKFEHIRLAFQVLIESGIRLSELTKLVPENFIKINNKYYIEIIESKNDSRRIVPISSLLYFKIIEYVESRGYLLGRIFTLSNRAYQYHADQFSLKYNINFTVHSCRHTFATNMARKNVKVQFIQKMLGHKNIQTTMYYIQLSDSDILDLDIY